MRKRSITCWLPLFLMLVLSVPLVAQVSEPKHPAVLRNRKPATPENTKTFFNGKDLTGWKGDESLWSVREGVIVGHTETGIKKNSFLYSDLIVKDFDLTMNVRLTPNDANSGVQFRSEVLPDGLARGYQADMGQQWWGKLYHEHGRKMLWNKDATQHVKAGEWNEYRIVAKGHHIQTYLNGKLCVDLDDAEGETSGVIALQVHSGGPMKVEFKDLKLKVLE
ncbi:MAG: DUF1080 domain-containing protein [Planctomycetaceae bacterium]|jgi:hypothetical protein|nr:DUF1080 domain-containing protein [Planctomycetaceae bacterium]MDG2388452.1 DUF1080 domain-containing protein [Planctomycetaceae bacterium]